MSIVITAATGQYGRIAIQELLDRGVPRAEIRAGGRDEARLDELAGLGVQTHRIDYDDPATLSSAFEGASKLLFVSGSDVGRRIPQHTAVVKAAAAAGISFIAYASAPYADTTPMRLAAEHKATEQAIKETGIPYAMLRNGWYYENYLSRIPAYLEHGVVLGSAGDGRISGAARADLAAAAAVVINTGGQQNAIYELGADDAFTLTDLAASISAHSGTPVSYRDLPEAEFAAALAAAGIPGPVAAILAQVDVTVRDGWLEIRTGDLHRLIGRRPVSLDQAVAAALKD